MPMLQRDIQLVGIFLCWLRPCNLAKLKATRPHRQDSGAEYIAASDGATQAVSLDISCIRFRKDLRGSTPFYVDNQSAMKLSENPVLDSRSKHILIRYHAIRDFVNHREIKPIYIPTTDMLADSLTKQFSSEILGKFTESLNMKW